MADNVAQSIKNLQQNLEALDTQLLKSQQGAVELGNLLKQAMNDAGVSVEDFLKQIRNITKSATSAEKIRLAVELTDVNGKPLTAQGLANEIEKVKKVLDSKNFGSRTSVDIFGTQYTGIDIKQRYKELLEMQRMLQNGPALYDVINRIANKMGGGAAQQGTKLGQVRAEQQERVHKIAISINKELERQQKIEQAIASIQERGGKSVMFEKKRRSVEDLNNLLDQSKRKVEGFERELSSLGTRGQDVKKAFGLNAVKEEVNTLPTVFDRVIAQINQRSQNSGQNISKKLFNADVMVMEAKDAFARVTRELNAQATITRESGTPLLERLLSIDQSILSKNDIRKLNERIAKIKQDLSQVDKLQGTVKSGGQNQQLIEALHRYQEALQRVIQVQEQLNQSQQKFASNISAVEGVTRRYNDNEQALAKLQQRWEELNVKKQAGLISQKDFDTQTQKILDEYDRLIAKRKEFEIGDLGQMSYQRKSEREQEEERLAQLRKSNTQAWLDDEMRAEKKIKAERAKREAKENAAIREQVTNYKQLSALLKQYNSLKQVKGRTQEEEAALERTRQKIKEIIAEMRKLDSEQKGSLGKARDITEYDRILAKDREITNEKKKQNDLTKQQKASLEDMLPTLRRLASAFGVAFSVQGLVQFGKKLVETRGEFELQQVAMRSILQNKQLADEIWDKTMQQALQSPFTAMQLTRYTKQLAAYRIENDKLFDTTKRLADVSAGLGVDMQRLILAYGQVKAANYLRASEIRQFTEAGVNILGELSKYFTEIKGQMVSTAQVMDMVQKRMVKFEDVEEVFKRLTDAGGIFYDMQYVQSQTVKGQINKLHDAYDQMLNNIGKSNEGVIKNMVALLNRIVKNWREWKFILDTIAWPALALGVVKFGKGLLTAGSAARLAANEIRGLEKAGTKIRNIIGNVNPWLVLAAAITTATFAIIDHVKAVKAIRKEINEQNLRLYETQELLNGYQKTLEANNKSIKEGTLSEDELKEKRQENSAIIAKLKNDYPQLAKGLELQRDGTVKLTNALKDYNDELERQMTLNNLLGMGGGWFSDTVKTNMQEWSTDLSQIKAELIDAQSKARMAIMQIKLSGNENDPRIAFLQKISELNLSDVEKARDQYFKLVDEVLKLSPSGFWGQYKEDYIGDLPSITNFAHDAPQVRKDISKLQNFLMDSFQESVKSVDDYAQKITTDYNGNIISFIANNSKIINEGVLSGNADVVKTIRTAFQTAGIALTAEDKAFYNKILNERLRYLAVQEALNDTEKHSFLERVQVANEIYKNYKNIDFFANPVGSSSDSPFGDGNGKGHEAQKMISLIKEMNSEYMKLSQSAYDYAKANEKVMDVFKEAFDEVFKVRGGEGTYIDYNNLDITSKSGVANALQALYNELERTTSFEKFGKGFKQELLKAISSANAEVDIELSARVREDFTREVDALFNNYQLTLDLQKLNLPADVLSDMFDVPSTTLSQIRAKINEFFRTQGSNLDKEDFKKYEAYINKIDDLERKQMRERLKNYSKYLEYQVSERAKLEMEYVKKMAEVQAETSFSEQQKKRISEGLRKEYEEAISKQDWEDFKGSEFYVGMMEDVSKQSTASLEVMRRQLLKLRDNAKNLSPRALKEMVNALEKIDEVEQSRKAPLQRIREEAEKLKGTKIEEVIKKLAEAEEKQATDQARLASLSKIIGARQQEANVLSVIKASDYDILEIEGESVEERLSNVKDELAFLREKIRLNKQNKPLVENENDVSFRNWRYVQNELEAQEGLLLGYIQQLETLYKVQDILNSEEFAWAKELSLNDLLEDEDLLKNQLKLTDIQIKNLRSLKDSWNRLKKAEKDALDETKNYLDTTKTLLSQTYTMVDNFGMKTNEVTEYWKGFGETVLDSATAVIDAIKTFKEASDAAENATSAIATGDYIKLILVILNSLVKLLGELGLSKNARINKEINEQQERIDSLSSAYERLENQIEKTLDTISYMQTYSQEVANLREQIAATEAQLFAARSRKNADTSEINGYQNSLYDLRSQLSDLQSQMQETFGGIGGSNNYRSWTAEFVSEWRNAFLETGDGLEALQDHFDEFLQSWFEKQATMRVAGKMMEPLMQMIDSSVDDGILTRMELDNIKERAAEIFPELSEQLRELYQSLGFGNGQGSLSGLAQAISGMTEEQGDILASYWNSVRLYVASIDSNVALIATALGLGNNGVNTNPMLVQLQSISRNTSQIYTLLSSLTGNGPAARGLRVYVNNLN